MPVLKPFNPSDGSAWLLTESDSVRGLCIQMAILLLLFLLIQPWQIILGCTVLQPEDAFGDVGINSEIIDLSIVVPVLNEEEVVQTFVTEVSAVLEQLGVTYEILFIDDGSTDATAEVITDISRRDPSVKLVQLSRNFGKEAALTAGLEWAGGDAVVPMDVDLQDPPEVIRDFVRLWREGYDTVIGKRQSRDSDTRAKRLSAQLFYSIYNRLAERPIEADVGDFRLMNRKVVAATLRLRERNRFMKGLFGWAGYRTAMVPYERASRKAGQTKFNYWRLWNFALDGITSFSTVPLRIWSYVGGVVAFGAVLYLTLIVLQTLLFGRETPGWASVMVVVLLLGAVQLITLGIFGEYLGRLYIEAKGRPIYQVMRTEGELAPPEDVCDALEDPPPLGRRRAS